MLSNRKHTNKTNSHIYIYVYVYIYIKKNYNGSDFLVF